MWKHPAETLETLPQMRRGEMRQEILTGALKPMHREAGLKLTHPRAHLLCLETQGGSPICYFDAKGATIQEVHAAVNNWMMYTDIISYIGGK